jgi:hypothetical protein
MVVTMSLHLYFMTTGWGNIRGLSRPSGWCQRTQGVGSSFRLVPINQGVVASFWLVQENSGTCSFLQFGSYKSGGWCLLLVAAK